MITVTTGSIGGNVISTETVNVTAVKKAFGVIGDRTYVEADGYVSMEAEHYTNAVSYGGTEWRTEKDYARSGDSMKLYPNIYRHTDNADMTNSAYLEYSVYFENAGTYELDIYRMPTLNERGSVNVRVGVNDCSPTELVGNKAYYVNDSCGDDAWGLGVLTNNETLSTEITVSEGLNTIRVYGADTGFVFDKIVITTSESKPFSYFGAPESYNTTYNDSVTLPEASVTKPDGEPENEGVEQLVYSQDFSEDPSSDSALTLENGASYDSAGGFAKLIKTGSSGSGRVKVVPNMIYAEPGKKVRVSTDIRYGAESGKSTAYRVVGISEVGGANVDIMNISANTYQGTGKLMVGGEDLFGGKFPTSLIKGNTSVGNAPWINYTTVYDFETGGVTVTVTNRSTGVSAEYTGNIEGMIAVTMLEATTSQTTSGRHCNVDNISITEIISEYYGSGIGPSGD